MPFIAYYKHADKSRFTAILTREDLQTAIEDLSKMIPPNSTSQFEVRQGSKVIWRYEPNINPKRIEPLVGDNLGMLELKVDKCHVAESYLSVVRRIKATIRNWSKIPRPLRRGFIQATLARHKHNREFYLSVMKQSWDDTWNIPKMPID